ncbi:hypothetical protein ABEB36_000504 [Hypothenemus hampei]|uniref:Zinc finger CCCH domain-containing protein 3 n=1 Tax=Hypothenemus hampei TaxID=57062 RepID=A0ABD1FBF6_HYPHA
MENYVYMCTMYDTVPQSINVNQATQRVLINPHFKANSKVFVNPNFVPSRTIHINPLLTTGSLKNIPDTNNQSNTVHINPLFSHKTASKCEDTKECPSAINRAIVLTKTKLIRSPYLKKKLVRNKDKIQKFGGTRACQSTNTRFKLDNRSQMLIGVAKKSTSRKLKINKLFRENNLSRIIKHTTLNQSMINICGIMYRKSKTSLRRTSNSSISQKKTFSNKKVNKDALKMKIVRLTSPKKNIHGINLDKKLKKCNIPCPLYKKYGICKAQISGKCFLKHDPDQIALCTRFLQGACIKSKCLLSHNVAPEKMPTCKYYLEGSCTRENCPYLHVKISSKADICRDFLEGFCKKASEVHICILPIFVFILSVLTFNHIICLVQ